MSVVVNEEKLGASIATNIGQELRGILTAYGFDKLIDNGVTVTFAPGTKIKGIEIEGEISIRGGQLLRSPR